MLRRDSMAERDLTNGWQVVDSALDFVFSGSGLGRAICTFIYSIVQWQVVTPSARITLMAHDFGISRKGDAYGYLRPEADLARLGHILSWASLCGTNQ